MKRCVPAFAGASGSGLDWRALLYPELSPHPRRRNLKASLSFRGMIDRRGPAVFQHAAMDLRPRRRIERFLSPMGDGGYIAPIREPRHHAAVRARDHEAAHRALVRPQRPGPEREIQFSQQRNRKISGRGFGLAPHAVNRRRRLASNGTTARAAV